MLQEQLTGHESTSKHKKQREAQLDHRGHRPLTRSTPRRHCEATSVARESRLHHVRCLSSSNANRLHLRRRPLSSRPSSKDAAPSEGREAHPRARRADTPICRGTESSTGATARAQPTDVAASTDSSTRRRLSDAGTHRRHGTEEARAAKKGQSSTRSLSPHQKHQAAVAAEGNPFPSRPGSRAPTRRWTGHVRRLAAKEGALTVPDYTLPQEHAAASTPQSASGSTTSPAQDDVSKESATPERLRCPLSRELGFSPGHRGGEREGAIPHRRLQGGERRQRRRRRRGHHSWPRISPGRAPDLANPAKRDGI